MIKIPKGTKLAIVGDIHEHDNIFKDLLDKINPSKNMWVISLGDLFDKGYGFDDALKSLNRIKDLYDNKIGYVIMGNHDHKLIKKARKNTHFATKEVFWLSNQPRALIFKFENNTIVTCVHAGVTPNTTWKDLENHSTELMYIRLVNPITGKYIGLIWKDGKLIPKEDGGVSWATQYDGRFGHIVAGHEPMYDGKPQYHPHATQIDTAVFNTGILTALIFDENGKQNIIQAIGKPKYPQNQFNND